MKAKKEHIILAAIILALGLYLLLRSPDNTQYQLPQIPDIDPEKITKIEIVKPEISLVLKKEGDNWHIAPEEYPADTDKVERMIETVGALIVTALVAESKSYARYDLTDDKKITVKAWIGEKLARDFDLGKAASSFRHTFVKLADDDRVYHARGNFRGQFDQTVDKLRDKVVLSFDQIEIEKVRLVKDKEDLTFSKTQAPVEVTPGQDEAGAEGAQQPAPEITWQTADGKKGKKNELNRLLTTLSNLRCEKYIDDQKKEDFTSPIYTIELNGLQPYSLSIFAKADEEAKNYPAVSSASDYPFQLPQWQADNLMNKPGELIEESKNETKKKE